jgi:hypothetical protein
MLKSGNLAGSTKLPDVVGEAVSLTGSGDMVGTAPDTSVVNSGGRGVLPPWLMTVTGAAIKSERVTRIFMAIIFEEKNESIVRLFSSCVGARKACMNDSASLSCESASLVAFS